MPRVNLTDRFVAGAKPLAGARVEYFDAGCKGLSLRVGESGHKAWTYHFRTPGESKRARVQLGTYPALSLAGARTRAFEAKGHVEDGTDPRAAFAAHSAAEPTVADLVASYIAKHVRPHLRTAARVERRFQTDVLPVIGAVKAADLHRRDINQVLDPIMARGSAVKAARVFEDLRAAFRWAVARGDLDHSPMEGMRKPGVSRPRERVLSDDEIRELWNGLPKALARSKTCQRIICLLLVTGQRVGEVAGMRRDELDLAARTWTIPGARTKNGRTHVVPLSEMAIAILADALAAAGEAAYVFPCGGGPLDPHAVTRTVGRAHQATEKHPDGRFGLLHFTAHDLRRTVLTNLAKLGVAPVVAGAVANHVSVTKATVTLRVYTAYSYESEKRAALDLWASRLAAIVAGHGAEVVPLHALEA